MQSMSGPLARKMRAAMLLLLNIHDPARRTNQHKPHHFLRPLTESPVSQEGSWAQLLIAMPMIGYGRVMHHYIMEALDRLHVDKSLLSTAALEKAQTISATIDRKLARPAVRTIQ
eukprot:4910200-Amphidinium_carterae.1